MGEALAVSHAWLRDCARNVYSQFGEDGVVDAIFKVIQPANRWCFECGAADGIFFSNTRRLVCDGWDAVLVEADQDTYRRLCENTKGHLKARAICDRLTEIDPLLRSVGAPHGIDLAVIDVDGQDYHLFNSMLRFRPRVAIVEFDPNADPDFIPDIGGAGQAGLAAIRKLAMGRFYTEVYRSWCNLVLVSQPLDRLLNLTPEGSLPC